MKQTPNGTEVTNFDIAVNKKWTDQEGVQQEKVEFVSFVAFKGKANVVCNYAKKWDKIFLSGEMQTRSWETEDWTKRYKTEIFVNKVILLGNSGGWEGQSQKPKQSNQNNGYASKPLPPKPKPEEEISIEDIPF